MLENIKPRFEIGQKVNIASMGIPLTVEITKRIVIFDFDDTSVYKIMYNMEHKIKNGWTWDKVREDDLFEWIYDSRNYFNK